MEHSKIATAAIALMHDDNTLTSVRVRQGGEPKNAGAVLTTYYTRVEDIKDLLVDGDIIELVREAHYCTYCKDDTEIWHDIETKEHKSLGHFFARHSNEVDYLYIFNLGKWYCQECNND